MSDQVERLEKTADANNRIRVAEESAQRAEYFRFGQTAINVILQWSNARNVNMQELLREIAIRRKSDVFEIEANLKEAKAVIAQEESREQAIADEAIAMANFDRPMPPPPGPPPADLAHPETSGGLGFLTR